MPPESEFDIIPFRLQPEELEADMRHPYVKDLYKNYRRLRKKQEKIIVTRVTFILISRQQLPAPFALQPLTIVKNANISLLVAIHLHP